jgi:iron complex transport system permease protein
MQVSLRKASNMLAYVLGGEPVDGVQFTLNRYLMITMCGAALAMSGCCYQGAFRNLLASPTVLGVDAGGMLGSIVYVLFFFSVNSTSIRFSDALALLEDATLLERNIQVALIFAGCLLAVGIVAASALFVGRGRIRPMDIIMSGLIFGSLIRGVSTMVQYTLRSANSADIRAQILRDIQMGNFNRAFTYEHLIMMAVFMIPCCALMLLMSGRLNILSLDEEEAATMGVNVRTLRVAVISINTLVTAVAMSFCGHIGFVGLISPLIARRFVGPDFRRLMPASMMLGSLLLIIVSDVAAVFGMTGYIGLFTAGIGSLAMIAAYIKGRGVTDVS